MEIPVIADDVKIDIERAKHHVERERLTQSNTLAEIAVWNGWKSGMKLGNN